MREDVVRAVPQLRHGLRRSCDGNRGIERPDTAIADLEKQLFFFTAVTGFGTRLARLDGSRRWSSSYQAILGRP